MKGNFSGVSPLEQEALRALWPQKRLRVRQIYDVLRAKHNVALTSVAVAMDRLHKKGLVERAILKGRGGLRYVYFPKKTRDEYERRVIEKSVDALIDQFGAAAITYFHKRFPAKKKRLI